MRWSCIHHADDHGPGGEASGPSDQAVPGTLAGGGPRYAGHMVKPIIPLETRTKAIELVLDGMCGSRPPNDSA